MGMASFPNPETPSCCWEECLLGLKVERKRGAPEGRGEKEEKDRMPSFSATISLVMFMDEDKDMKMELPIGRRPFPCYGE